MEYGKLMDKTIQLESNAVISLQLTAVEVQTIVIALKELPYKHAQPVLDHLLDACTPKPSVEEAVDGDQ